MAKINANGATEVAKIRARSEAGYEYLYVMCSDGRVLRRATGDAGSSYTVLHRRVPVANRTRAKLLEAVTALGMTEV